MTKTSAHVRRIAAAHIRSLVPAAFVMLTGLDLAACSEKEHPLVVTPDAGAACDHGAIECDGEVEVRCERGSGATTRTTRDCRADSLVCITAHGCVACIPEQRGCASGHPAACAVDGSGFEPEGTCDLSAGLACRDGACVDLCERAAADDSYEGCEFYPVDLDHGFSVIDGSRQQYAVAVSNPQSFPVDIVVEQNDAPRGEAIRTSVVAGYTVAPRDLVVIELPRREVDGSTQDGVNDGTHTALTRNAYRLRAEFPVIAYQFNPLDRGTMYTADASLLLPVAAAGMTYTAIGWPQAHGPRPGEEDGFAADIERSFLTIVGTAEGTHVRVKLGPRTIKLVGSPDIPEAHAGETVEFDLGPFDVANLETVNAGSDFSGSVVSATKPVVVYTGSEMTDVPIFENLSYLRAADHLEEQLLPDSALGTEYVLANMPSRTRALAASLDDPTRAQVIPMDEGDWFRVIAPGTTSVVVETTLPAPDDRFELEGGELRDLHAFADVTLRSSGPVSVMQFVGGQESVGIRSELPGGDPAASLVPPVAQWRSSYVFLTPPLYAFDFAVIVADEATLVRVDDRDATTVCDALPVGTSAASEASPRVVYRCQLSFPSVEEITPVSYRVNPGMQRDGVHRIDADQPVGLVVYGFDQYISYAYPGGLDTRPLL